MKAVFLLSDGFEDLQVFHILYRLREERTQVTLAAATTHKLTGLHGYVIEPDMPIHEINPSEYQLLYIPGGHSPERLRLREEAVDIARTFIQEDRLVCICGHGAQLLISAGALDGKTLTCAAGIRDDIRSAGGIYRDEPVVVDDNLISARENGDLPTLTSHLMHALSVRA
ncbi:DJ-1/PfpI family protein [Telmatocola sphagniphila]|jgi:protease I|uniref:DJ-1/PfpI family protein n=1 Tax=Telmatocola sphagniphila TaxID=1123043 RepID=A0A8E6B4R5_9BACT|nr:DJ-1/PfpI family protein [Telmatocola sphagniphila]QVL30483.1 DJ-1/PfpI family protein [Telmatocola sphagniphila]